MTALAYGKGTYRRLAAGLPELRLINMYVEAAATSQDNVVLLSRPGLKRDATLGSGPIRGIYQQAGTIDGRRLTLSGLTLYAETALGAVSGDGPASFAGSATEVVIAAGGGIARTDGTNVQSVSFPDDASVLAVAYIGSLFVAVRAQSQRFYWSASLDGTSWDALDYAAAESSPDLLLDAIVSGDVLWLLGASSIEPWSFTGAADLPFSRIEGRNYERGVLTTGCAAELDNTIFWVGDDRRVYRGGSVPEGLSDPGIEERIAASANVRAFVIEHDGHKFFCVRLDAETLAYDVSTKEWCQFASYGRSNWRVGVGYPSAGRTTLGDASDGTLWSFDDGLFSDDGVPLERLLTAFQPISDGAATLDTLHLDAEFGATPLLVGQGSDPRVELRSSRDNGRTWSAWRTTSLGKQGAYRFRSVWRRFGAFDAPGALFEIRVTDPVRLRVSAVRANEAQGGRSR